MSSSIAPSVASKRLFSEYKNLSESAPEGISAGPVNEDDIFTWEALIQGPEDTPFEGGVFPAELKFPKDYPLMPPTMRFLCEMWHPNGTFSSPIPFPFPSFLFLCSSVWWLIVLISRSLSKRLGVYFYPPRAGRRSKRLRTRFGALVAHPVGGENLD